MTDLKLAEDILAYIRKGGTFEQVTLNYPPKVYEGTRFDRLTIGYHYMPWLFDAGFLGHYQMAEKIEAGHYGGMAVAPRAYILMKAAETALQLASGDFVECGVFRGGSALLAAEVIRLDPHPDKPAFHLFDTFGGVPEAGLSELEAKTALGNTFNDTTLEQTQTNLAAYHDLLHFHPGYVPDTFADCGVEAVRYLHIDINTGKATRECLEFFLPKLVEGAVVVFDDYGWPGYLDCKRATDAFFTDHQLPLPIPLTTGQAIYTHHRNARRILGF